MSNARLITIGLMLAVVMTAAGQQRRRAKKPAAAPPQPTEQELRRSRMVEATQRVMFVDSVVVGKDQLLSILPLSSELGHIATTRQLPGNGTDTLTAHSNEWDNRCYYAAASTTGGVRLYASNRIGGKWDEGTPLNGANDERFEAANYPFVMPDGQTLYFAATGGDGLGGYDIYVTRYDEEAGRFLKPENLGMPFNSDANDYLYIVDETNGLGWFATDRNQPADSVCLYTFVPTDERATYEDEGLELEQLERRARLACMADTQTDRAAYAQAVARLQALKSQAKPTRQTGDIVFVVNDQTVYRSYADFRAAANADRYRRLVALRQQAVTMQAAIDKARRYYATANAEERRLLQAELTTNEAAMERTQRQIKEEEKQIRNAENQLLNK